MANKKISELTTASGATTGWYIPICDSATGITYKMTASAFSTLIGGGGGDVTAPTVVSATANTATTIVVVFSESVTVTTAGWSFKKNGTAWTISSVSGSGTTWTFTMGSSGVIGDTITRTYDSATGNTVDTSSNELVSFTDQSVTNGIGDTTAPTVVSATATTATNVQIVFSESVTVTTAGWSFKKNGSAWSITSVAGSGTTWNFTMGASATGSDTLLRSYDSTTGATVDTASNELVTFTDQSVTNGIVDSDAAAFFSAYSITDATQKSAVNQLVIDLKAASIWTKMSCIYPFVGGDSAKHAGNLKSPGTYDLTFVGGWTHSSTGALPNGTSGYANTAFNPFSHLSQFSLSFGIYSRTSTSSGSGNDRMPIGVLSSGSQFSIDFYNSGGVDKTQGCGSGAQFVTDNPATSYTRLTLVTRVTDSSLKMYRDGTQLSTTNTTTITSTLPNDNVWLGALNNGGSAAFYDMHELAFAFVGDGLNATEITALNTAVNTFETTLSRNV